MQENKAVQTRLDRVIEWLGDKMSVIFLVIVAISFYEVVMRKIFNAPTIWVHELAAHLGGFLFIFGGAYAFATDKHVRVVLLYDKATDKTRAYLNIFHHIMGIIFSVLMAWASYIKMKEAWFAPWGEFRIETTGTVWNSHLGAYLKAVIFIVMIILTIQFLLHLIVEIKRLSSGYYDQVGGKDV